MIEDIYEELIDGKIDTYECVIIAKELIAEVRRLRKENNKLFAMFADYIEQEESKQFEYPDQFQYPEETWSSVNLEGLIYDCNFWTEDDGQKYITFYQCFMDGEKKKYMNTDVTDNFVTFKLIPTDPNMGSKGG